MNMDQYIGRLLDQRYEILEVIGTGGMAVVYKARCHRLNRLVAIKILKDEFARDEEFRRRFHAEGEAVAMLSHPNIVQVYDVSSTESANYIVMELIEGISLKQYMEKKGVLNWKETLHFAMQIAKGLEHAHSRGIVHRDIKPHNVMVLKNGSVKVMDFGIARMMNKSNTLTKEALGSVHYISPEQAKGGHTDNRSDLYSLSVVMYEMMAGRPPYDGESAVSVAIQHINGGAALPSVFNPNIPSGLEQIIMKGMSLEIRDRYVSATEMLQDMEEFRKNPAITFDYKTLLDDATRPIPTAGIPRTTAEKVVQAKNGTVIPEDAVRQRQMAAAAAEAKRRAAAAAAANPPQKKPAVPPKKTQERSRVATTAIVIVSAVLICAIAFFLIALFNGVLLNRENRLVDVPYVEGKLYNEKLALELDDFNVHFRPQEYNNAVEKGHIIEQNPSGGSEVVKGSDLWITISMGVEPEKKVLDDVSNNTAEEAEKFLIGKGFDVLKKYEASYVYDEGKVIRTEPAAGTEMAVGQTVYLWISTGEAIIEEPMPNVVGLDISRALEFLSDLGFKNVKTQPVESDEKAGTVVYQSIKKNEEVDVTTELILEVSEGPKANTPSDVETMPDAKTVKATFTLPVKENDFTLKILYEEESLGEWKIEAGSTSTTITLTGSGSQNYDLYIDGEFYQTQRVKFTDG